MRVNDSVVGHSAQSISPAARRRPRRTRRGGVPRVSASGAAAAATGGMPFDGGAVAKPAPNNAAAPQPPLGLTVTAAMMQARNHLATIPLLPSNAAAAAAAPGATLTARTGELDTPASEMGTMVGAGAVAMATGAGMQPPVGMHKNSAAADMSHYMKHMTPHEMSFAPTVSRSQLLTHPQAQPPRLGASIEQLTPGDSRGGLPPLNVAALRPGERPAAYEYDVFLNELTFNSKDIINNLTKIAGENMSSVNAIAHAIEQRILVAPPPSKLPVLYLLDSIVKNIGDVYIHRFRRGAFRCFICTYDAGTPQVRASLHRLLNTWPQIFGGDVVDTIRRHITDAEGGAVASVHGPPPPSSFGPAFVASQGSRSSAAPFALHQPPRQPGSAGGVQVIQQASPYAAAVSVTANPQLTHIDRLFADLSRKVSAGIPPSPLDLNSLSSLINGQLHSVTLSPIERNKLYALQNQLYALGTGALQAPEHVPSRIPMPMTGLRSGLPPPVSVAAPLTALMASFSQNVQIPRSTPPVLHGLPFMRPLPVLDFSQLKSLSHSDVVRALYTELTFLSKSDGMRFRTQTELRNHLDWLFAQNKRKRARQRAATGSGASRCWYDPIPIFLGVVDRTAPGSAFAKPAGVRASISSDPQTPASHSNVPIQSGGQSGANVHSHANIATCPAKGQDETCPSCCEGFQSYWDDDKQSWMLRGGVRADFDDRAYHTGCFTAEAQCDESEPDDGATDKQDFDGCIENTCVEKPEESKSDATAVSAGSLQQSWSNSGRAADVEVHVHPKAEEPPVDDCETSQVERPCPKIEDAHRLSGAAGVKVESPALMPGGIDGCIESSFNAVDDMATPGSRSNCLKRGVKETSSDVETEGDDNGEPTMKRIRFDSPPSTAAGAGSKCDVAGTDVPLGIFIADPVTNSLSQQFPPDVPYFHDAGGRESGGLDDLKLEVESSFSAVDEASF